MKVYHYHPDTKAYTSSSDEATLPAHATATAPPTIQGGWFAVWGGSAWTLTEIPAPDPDAVLFAQIVALEALQTPRLLREAMKKKAGTVNKPGTIIHGLSPEDAIDALDTAISTLRGQISGEVYYHISEM